MRVIHNLYKHPLYGVWEGMKQRCYNTNAKYYENYGGRGIKVCDEWVNDPKSFVEWGLSHGHEKGLQIDRKDNNGIYSPENCRFVTHSTNSANQRVKKNSTTGYAGVYLCKKRNMYWAHLYHKKRISLGYHILLEDAVVARNAYIKLHGLPHPLQALPTK
jgi:hypothetical protein